MHFNPVTAAVLCGKSNFDKGETKLLIPLQSQSSETVDRKNLSCIKVWIPSPVITHPSNPSYSSRLDVNLISSHKNVKRFLAPFAKHISAITWTSTERSFAL